MQKIRQIFLIAMITSCPLVAVSAPTKVVMQLDWIFNAQFAGLYQAIEQGYFAEAGMEVELRPAQPSLETVDLVLAHDGLIFGSAESNVLINRHAGGAPIRAVATMFQDSPIGWMYLKSSGIERFADFVDRRIGIHKDGEKILAVMALASGVDVADFQLPKVGYNLDPLLTGEVDAMQCYAIDEFVKLQLETMNGGGVIMAKDLGYRAYSQVVFTTAAIVDRYPAMVAAFLGALQRGWDYAIANKEETVSLIISRYNSGLDAEYQLQSLMRIADLVRPDGHSSSLAPINPEVLDASLQRYLEHGLISGKTDIGQLVDLRFNP